MSVENVVTEAEYYDVKKSLENKLIKLAIGFAIGVAFGIYICIDTASGFNIVGILVIVICGFYFAGMPYAWSVIPVNAYGIMAILIKLFASIFLGWIITPISLIYTIIKLNSIKKQLGI